VTLVLTDVIKRLTYDALAVQTAELIPTRIAATLSDKGQMSLLA